MITRPFNFETHLTRPHSRLDLVPFVDVGVILLFFGLLGSRFVLAPGVAINLRLPATAAATLDALPTSRVLTVMEVEGHEMLIFEGRILNLASFERLLKEQAADFSGDVLLVRLDRDVSTSLLARVCELAAHAGFNQVLLAAEPEPAASVGGGVGK
jgi:biopolymer transport protein ExbD